MDITHHYDEISDVLYIDFGSEEPCYGENLDDRIITQIGWFSNQLKGFIILSPFKDLS